MTNDSPNQETAPKKLTNDNVDVGLMLRIGNRDEKALEELIERHQGAVIGTVAKMLGNSSDAEDIAQQVFIRIWKYKASYCRITKLCTLSNTLSMCG